MEIIVCIVSFVPHYNIDLYKSLYEHYKNKGDEFYLISMKNPPSEGRSGEVGEIIPNHYFYNDEYKIMVGRFRYYWQKGILKIINKLNPNKIIIHGHIGNITSWVVALFYKSKIYSWICGYEYHKSSIKDILLNIYLRLFFHHLAYHTGARNYLLRYGIPENKISILHNTINEKKLKVVPKKIAKEYLCSKLNIEHVSKILLYVGTILEEKNIDKLVDIMKYLSNDYKLVIVGDGPYKHKLDQLTSEMNNVYLVGSKFKDKHYYFAGADLFLLPGTGGLALNEALFYNLPILSGYADGSAEDLVINDFNGYRIDNMNVKDIAKLIKTIFSEDKIINLQKNSKILINKFTFKNYLERIINAI